jgi:hypothetical protein
LTRVASAPDRALLLDEQRDRQRIGRHVGRGARLQRDHIEERLLRCLRDGARRGHQDKDGKEQGSHWKPLSKLS